MNVGRVGGDSANLRPLGVAKRRTRLIPFVADRGEADYALQYTNGFVSVQISHDAMDRYVALYGDVPLPVTYDPHTGDKRVYDSGRDVKAVWDRDRVLREVQTRSSQGHFIRVNFVEDGAA